MTDRTDRTDRADGSDRTDRSTRGASEPRSNEELAAVLRSASGRAAFFRLLRKIAQAAVAVEDNDTEESLHERIKLVERTLVADTVGRMAREGWTVDGRAVRIGKEPA